MIILDPDKNVVIGADNNPQPDPVKLDRTTDALPIMKKNRIKFELEGMEGDTIRVEFEDQGPFRPRPNESRGVYEAIIDGKGKATVKTQELDRLDRKCWKYTITRYRGGSEHSKNDPRLEIKD